MRAIVCEDFGGIDALKLAERPAPQPGPDEVAIDVAAAGVNFADTLMATGEYQEKPPTPFSPGLEVAGTVRSVGTEVAQLKPGDRVLAVTGHGGFAEVATAKAGAVFVLPESMDFTTAAGFPVTYGTAHGALVWRAALQPGETLVVHGAAGGAGLATVEVGKAMGARVIATAGGPEKLEIARAHGADAGIDYRSEDLRARLKELTDGRGADVVFDPVGGAAFEASLRTTAWGGRIVTIGFASGEVPKIPANILLVKNLAVFGFYWGSYIARAPARFRQQFEDLFRWYEAGALHPLVSHSFPLEETAEALRMLKNRKATGKIVVQVDR